MSVNYSVLSIMCVEVVFAKGFGRAGRLRGRGGVNSKMSCNCPNSRRRVWSKVVQSVEDGGTTHISSRPSILVSSLPRDATSCAIFDSVIWKGGNKMVEIQAFKAARKGKMGSVAMLDIYLRFGIWDLG